MKNFQKLLLLAALALVSTFVNVACHSHDDEDDTTAPELTIESPTEGTSYSGEVHVHGIVKDESLHEMEIKVTKDSDGSEVLKVTPTVHDETEYDFDEHFELTGVAEEIALTLTITVSDHSDHTTTKTVKFKAKS